MSKDDSDATTAVCCESATIAIEPADAKVDGSIFTQLLTQGRKEDVRPPSSPVVVGRLLGLIEEGRVPLVALPGPTLRPGVRARSVMDLYNRHVGREVILIVEPERPNEPIVIGVLQDAGDSAATADLGPLELSVDGERVIVSAATELVLRCGKSRLTLRSDGRIEVTGETIVSRATGAHRIQGGSVQLN
jgi:uncharacterized protein DUF6484